MNIKLLMNTLAFLGGVYDVFWVYDPPPTHSLTHTLTILTHLHHLSLSSAACLLVHHMLCVRVGCRGAG
jgi:hypothetical protein